MCAGNPGTVVKVDSKDSCTKFRVLVVPGKATDLWYGKPMCEAVVGR